MKLKLKRLLGLCLLGLPLLAQADYFDCRAFDDKALCKLLNKYPAVKDLPVFDSDRVLNLYRSKRDYAEDLFEGNPLVIRGRVAESQEKSGRVTLILNDGEDKANGISLQLFASQPVAAEGGRIASRSAKAVHTELQLGQSAVFQCVGDGLAGKMPVFKNCVLWQ